MLRSISTLAALALIQCGSPGDVADNVAARVGDKEITREDLTLFAAETPALLRSEAAGIDAAKDYLQTLIDMELMLVEAHAKGLDKEAQFTEQWEQEQQNRIVKEYLERHVLPESQPSEQEVREQFAKSKWSRLLKLAHIRVETEEQAQQVVEELERGRPFAEVAAERSANQATAANGGLLGDHFIGRENLRDVQLPLSIAHVLFEVPEGEVSQPFQIRGAYEIFKVLDEAPAPDYYLQVFAQWLFRQNYDRAQQERVAGLKPKYRVEVDTAAVAFLIAEGSKGSNALWDIAPADRERILGRYDRGHFTIQDLMNAYWQARFQYRLEFSREGIADFIDTHILSLRLFYLEALEEGLDEDPAVVAWLHNKKEALLLEALKEREVQALIDTTDASARRYYENNLHKFMEPRATVILEILVPTHAMADSLLREIEGGADMETLAVRHTTRQFARQQQGRIHLHAYERALFGPLHDEAMEKAPIGELKGPLALEEGFSIFKVEERIPDRPEPFLQTVRRAKYWLRKSEENKYFEELIVRLREQYAAQVEVFEEHLVDLEL